MNSQDKQIIKEEQEETNTGREILKEQKEQMQIINNYTGDADFKARPTF